MLAAMPGFWVTARTSSPSRVRFQEQKQQQKHQRQNKDPHPDRGKADHIIDRNRPCQPIGRGQGAGLGAKDDLGQLLQRDGNAEGRQQRFQRALVEVADHRPLHRHAGGEGHGKGQRQRHDQAETCNRG
jgi:hypothetical protein